jgi:membrane protein CcdC involved in cytochrome C biogenesis
MVVKVQLSSQLGARFGFVASSFFHDRWHHLNAIITGTVLSVIFIFFTLQFPKGGNINLNWWGNTVFINSASLIRRIVYPNI